MKFQKFLGLEPEKPKPQSLASKKNTPWTKAEVEAVLDMWNDHSVTEIANAVSRGVGSVQYIVTHLRKAGFKLKRKQGRFYPQSTAIVDALEDLRKDKLI